MQIQERGILFRALITDVQLLCEKLVSGCRRHGVPQGGVSWDGSLVRDVAARGAVELAGRNTPLKSTSLLVLCRAAASQEQSGAQGLTPPLAPPT